MTALPVSILPTLKRRVSAASCVFVLLGTNLTADDDEKKSPIKRGVADKEKTGALPPLTSETNRRAAAAIAKQDWNTAQSLYEEIVKFAPDNAPALANLGAVCFQMGAFKDARTHLENALKHQPQLHHARVTLGMAYYQLGEYYLAISMLSRAVHEDPKDPRAHNYLAVALRQQGWIDGAEKELHKALEADETFAEAHFNLALICLERKKPAVEQARRHYYRAVELGPSPDKSIEKQLKSAN